MPKKEVASLKERLFSNRREGKRNQSARGWTQTAEMLEPDPNTNFKAPLNIKYKFLRTMSVRVYTLGSVCGNPLEKLINNTRVPWSWDAYDIIVDDLEIHSPTAVGAFAKPIPYVDITTWTTVSIPRLPFSYIKLCTNDASYLIQTPDAYQRDRLFHCVQWKKNVCKYQNVLFSTAQQDILVNELQCLVKLTMEAPLYMDDTNPVLLDIVSSLLTQNQDVLNTFSTEALITTLAPLFEEKQPSVEICNFFTKHCRACLTSRVVIEMFMPVVIGILKYNTNYGKNRWLRSFVKEYILAFSAQNNGEAATRALVQTIHGPLSVCPHKRILNNLLAVSLSTIYDSFSPPCETEKRRASLLKKKLSSSKSNDENHDLKSFELPSKSNRNELLETQIANFSKVRSSSYENNLLAPAMECAQPKSVSHNRNCPSHKDEKTKAKADWTPDVATALVFIKVLDEISTINDWLPGLAVLLQPVPIQKEAMQNEEVMRYITRILERILSSGDGNALWCLISLRERKDGWLQLVSPQNSLRRDEGVMFTKITRAFLHSARELHKVRKLVSVLVKTCLNSVLLLALRENTVMIEALCCALEYKVAVGQEELQIVSALKSTAGGNDRYEKLCEQQAVMRQMGGPEGFTLPPRSTDQDLQKFLKSGSCGNLKRLDLSFTHVSCKSADLISRLPALQHLNLWSSWMGDIGLRSLCERLNLESLNLCETQVTDDGIICLKDMTNLKDLNLNSTGITCDVYMELTGCLQNLTHCDVTYTEADAGMLYRPWGAQNNSSSHTSAPQKKLQYKQNI